MDAPETDTARPAPCPGCGKPAALCVCSAIEPIDNRIFVLILQHPQEKAELLGTARLLERQLRHGALKVGLSWPGLRRILGREADHKRWGVLYLGARTEAAALTRPVQAVDRSGQPLPADTLDGLEGIVVLDGTWSQAKTLWWRNPWLLKLRRLVLHPDVRSRYGRLRREPRPEALSTLEAAAFALAALERDPGLFERLLAPFDLLVKKIGEGPAKPTRRRRRS